MSALNLSGKSVRLATLDLEKDPENWARWALDSEYQRLLNSSISMLYSAQVVRSWLEKELGRDNVTFSIRALPEDVSVGFITLDGFDWSARSAWVGIGIGEADYRGRGLGTEAMRLMARYGFEELNLNRIQLNVFEYNPRAVHSYEKVGFVQEGRMRGLLNRYEKRWDLIYMGLLRADWEAQRKE